MNEQRPSEALDRESIRVVRDSTFSRFTADEAVFTVLGRDLDVAFLQYGPLHVSQTDHGEHEETTHENVVTEVARMRMFYGSFLTMVIQFLESGISEGRLKGEAIQKSMAEWIAAASQRDTDGEFRK